MLCKLVYIQVDFAGGGVNMTFVLRSPLSDFLSNTEISVWPLSEKKAPL